MAEPSPRGAISTDVGKPFVTVSIRGAEGNLLYNLVHNHPAALLLYNSAYYTRFIIQKIECLKGQFHELRQ